MMRILGFVPARGGSRGIPKKNLVKLNGKPLIKYTLETLKKINHNVKPFISTDDKSILNFCKKNGKYENYLRPKKLSNSKSNIIDAILHALDWLEKTNQYKPREWFIAPLHIIEKTVELIINGSIVNYRYDKDSEQIIIR